MAAAAAITAPPASPGPESASGSPSRPTSEVAASGIDDAYVLQVGAFREQASAQRAATEIGLEELRIIATRRWDEDWYVLVLGAYHSRVDAREAGEAYLQANPEGSIWVRSAVDLKESLINP